MNGASVRQSPLLFSQPAIISQGEIASGVFGVDWKVQQPETQLPPLKTESYWMTELHWRLRFSKINSPLRTPEGPHSPLGSTQSSKINHIHSGGLPAWRIVIMLMKLYL